MNCINNVFQGPLLLSWLFRGDLKKKKTQIKWTQSNGVKWTPRPKIYLKSTYMHSASESNVSHYSVTALCALICFGFTVSFSLISIKAFYFRTSHLGSRLHNVSGISFNNIKRLYLARLKTSATFVSHVICKLTHILCQHSLKRT